MLHQEHSAVKVQLPGRLQRTQALAIPVRCSHNIDFGRLQSSQALFPHRIPTPRHPWAHLQATGPHPSKLQNSSLSQNHPLVCYQPLGTSQKSVKLSCWEDFV
jgi:hypothetical protein